MINVPLVSYEPDIEILQDATNAWTKDRLVTFKINNFPKILLQEFNTHRMFSRNAASSRAIPVATVLENVTTAPYLQTPTANQKGMQGVAIIDEDKILAAHRKSLQLLEQVTNSVTEMSEGGLHKQYVNRYLEAWMTVPVIVSSTTYDNFFYLRNAPTASPDFHKIAAKMQAMYQKNLQYSYETPVGEWTYIFAEHMPSYKVDDIFDCLNIAAARAARVSYMTHNSTNIDCDKDRQLASMLKHDGHYSPFEHAAIAIPPFGFNTRNYRGFYSYRAFLQDVATNPHLTRAKLELLYRSNNLAKSWHKFSQAL